MLIWNGILGLLPAFFPLPWLQPVPLDSTPRGGSLLYTARAEITDENSSNSIVEYEFTKVEETQFGLSKYNQEVSNQIMERGSSRNSGISIHWYNNWFDLNGTLEKVYFESMT